MNLCFFIGWLFLVNVLLFNVIYAQQQQVCNLPNGRGQSTCMRLHHCNFFQDQIRQHGGRPPNDIVQNIRAHICPTPGFVCCPIIIYTTETPPPQIPVVDFNLLRKHRNINLVNDVSCGIMNWNPLADASPFEAPWTAMLGYVSIRDGNIHWECSGSFINNQYVLTAAHCIHKDLIKNSLVRLGEHTISSEKDCDQSNKCGDEIQDVPIKEAYIHPQYNAVTKENDVALLTLLFSVDTTVNNVKTICLPTSQETDFEEIKRSGKLFTVYGWSRKDDKSFQSDELQRGFLQYQDCGNSFSSHSNVQISQTQLCGKSYDQKSSCKGDSGGSIVITPYNHSKVFLYGIQSIGVECSSRNEMLPGVYLNIRYYLKWILDSFPVPIE